MYLNVLLFGRKLLFVHDILDAVRGTILHRNRRTTNYSVRHHHKSLNKERLLLLRFWSFDDDQCYESKVLCDCPHSYGQCFLLIAAFNILSNLGYSRSCCRRSSITNTSTSHNTGRIFCTCVPLNLFNKPTIVVRLVSTLKISTPLVFKISRYVFINKSQQFFTNNS